MKKPFLLAAAALGLAAAQPAAAQYYVVPFLRANQNPGGLNTDSEARYDIQPAPSTWNLLATGDANTQVTPVWSAVQALPFSFQFNGAAFTSYTVSTSGVLTFNPAAGPGGVLPAPSAVNRALPAVGIPDNSVMIWGMTLANTNDYLVSKTFGTAPNRQHWVQFNSASLTIGSAGSPVSGSFIYAAIVLEETTNKVYLVWQRSGAQSQGLTAGIQLNATTAVQIAPSPNLSLPDLADAGPIDNQYYEIAPGSLPSYDLSASYLQVPNVGAIGSPISIGGVVTNVGSTTINTATVNYKVGNGPVLSAPLAGYAAAFLDTLAFVHPTPFVPTRGGVLPIKAWLSNLNGQPDQQPANDTLRGSVVVGDSTMRRLVVEEDFTSSTCPPCNPGNINTRRVNRANPGKSIDIKLQQNFPAPGTDPYYSAESGARFGYYGGAFVPYMILDGSNLWNGGDPSAANSNSYSAASLNTAHARPALVRVGGTYTITGRTVAAQATVKPLLPVPAGRFIAHLVITERESRLNARTNGETRFYDVMKKMMPNQNGTPLPALASGQTYNLAQSHTFPAPTLPVTWQYVENFDSLRVVVFVQDVVTKEIYQGGYLTLQRPTGTRAGQAGPAFALAPNPAHGRSALLLSLPKPAAVRVEVLDALGRRLLDRPALALGAGAQEVALDLPTAAPGLYTVRLTTPEGVSTRKLTLE